MPTLPPLATPDDVEDRLGRDLSTDEQRRTSALLVDASAVVRAYVRRDFTLAESTVRLRPRGNKVLLPQRPVVQVLSVRSVLGFGPTEFSTPLPAWSHVAGHELYLLDRTLIVNAPTLDAGDENLWVEVTYTHGYETIPEDIISVVANLVVRNLTVPSGGMVDLETVGPYSVRYSTFTSGGPLALSTADRDVLNRYRTTSAQTIELRA